MTEPSNIIPISGALSPHQCEMRAADDAAAVAVLETLANEITAANQKAKGASRESLTHYRTVGEKLNAAKIAAGHGKFGAWAEGKGFKREWRRRLMSLAEHWHVLEPYLEGDGWEGGYSVKEACGIIDGLLGRGAASKTDKPQKPAREKSEKSPGERACRNRSDTITSEGEEQAGPPQPEASQTEPTLAEEIVRLLAELKAANERIDTLLWKNAKLESEVADLKANEAKILSGGNFMEVAAAVTAHLPI